MKEAIFEITSKRLGVTGVCERERPTGRGDYRWRSEKGSREVQRTSWTGRPAEVMTKNPKWIEKDALAAMAVQRMEEYSITSLFVFDSERRQAPVGIIHLHDLLKAGVV